MLHAPQAVACVVTALAMVAVIVAPVVAVPVARARAAAPQEHPEDAARFAALLQVGEDPAPADKCSVCTYVMANKLQQQPYLCRGLKTPDEQKMCVSVLESVFFWSDSVSYWVTYGCQQAGDSGDFKWVQPCPPRPICSWIKALDEEGAGFCEKEDRYKQPEAG